MNGRQYTHTHFKINQPFPTGYKSVKALTVSLLAFIKSHSCFKMFSAAQVPQLTEVYISLESEFSQLRDLDGNNIEIWYRRRLETTGLILGVEKLKIRKLIKWGRNGTICNVLWPKLYNFSWSTYHLGWCIGHGVLFRDRGYNGWALLTGNTVNILSKKVECDRHK